MKKQAYNVCNWLWNPVDFALAQTNCKTPNQVFNSPPHLLSHVFSSYPEKLRDTGYKKQQFYLFQGNYCFLNYMAFSFS